LTIKMSEDYRCHMSLWRQLTHGFSALLHRHAADQAAAGRLRRNILFLVIRQGMTLIGIGILLGLFGAVLALEPSLSLRTRDPTGPQSHFSSETRKGKREAA
jgi:hypothetical protein